MTKVKKMSRIIFLMLLCVLLSQFSLSARAETFNLDFIQPGSGYDEFDDVELLEKALGEQLPEAEREFLEKDNVFSLKINKQIPTRGIIDAIIDDYNKLTVIARKYEYTAANNATVVWTPFEVNGERLQKEGDEYKWSRTSVGDDEEAVTVTYNTELEIDKAVVNSLVNKTYDAAFSASGHIKEKEAQYNAAYEAYLNDVRKYEEYTAAKKQYEEDLAKYEKYCLDIATWNKAKARYDEYLQDMAKYEEDLEKYNAYKVLQEKYNRDLAEYEEYKKLLEDYERKHKSYVEFLNSDYAKKIFRHLEILKFIDTPVVKNRTLSGAILGQTVTTVLANKDDLIRHAGAHKGALNLAETATYNLRDLIASYLKCKDDASRYSYYISCYESLKNNFQDLLRALDDMFSERQVYNEIKRRGKLQEFEILLAQLFVISDALDSQPFGNYQYEYYSHTYKGAYLYDDKYRIDGKKPSDILQQKYFVEDISPEPLQNGYPAEQLIEPVAPQKVPEPVYPERVLEPTKPDTVQAPGEPPQTVTDPGEPPEEVTQPNAPEKYIPSAGEQALAALYDDGVVTRREEFKENIKIVYAIDVVKKFRNVNEVTVRFYSQPAGTKPSESQLLYEVIVETGTLAQFMGDLPSKERTGYTCEFDYWTTADGEFSDVNSIAPPKEGGTVLNLYPHFKETPNLYDVTWVLNEDSGEFVVEKCTYGEIPVYSGETPVKENEGYREFRFIGWDRDRQPIDENGATYVAQYEASILISWIVDGKETITSVWRGDVPQFNGEQPTKPADSRYKYTFSGWDRQPEQATEDTSYIAMFDREYLVSLGGEGAEVKYSDGCYTVDCVANRDNSCDISVLLELADQNNAEVEVSRSEGKLFFTADNVKLMRSYGVQSLNVDILQKDMYYYRYCVLFMGAERLEISPDIYFKIVSYGSFDYKYSKLYRISAVDNSASDARYSSDEENVRFSPGEDNKSISFTMRCGDVYEIYPTYNVNKIETVGVELTVSCVSSRNGEKVTVTADNVSPGKLIKEIYVVDSEGNRVEFNGRFFRMPASDVSVGITLTDIEYLIVFKADGKVLYSHSYHYGDTIQPPADPVKAPDGTYSYKFVGWDAELATVTADAEYNAVFEAEIIVIAPQSSTIAKIITAGLLFVTFVFCCMTLAFAYASLKQRKRSRARNRRGK